MYHYGIRGNTAADISDGTQYEEQMMKDGVNPAILQNEQQLQLQQVTIPDEPTTYSDPGTLVAVINTAKMATGSLTRGFLGAWDCDMGTKNSAGVHINGCSNSRTVLQSHKYDTAVDVIQKHRRKNPEGGKCLILTAVRSPRTWFQSQYLQRRGSCDAASMTVAEMRDDYKKFLSTFNIQGALSSALPQLLTEFNGGSLEEQFKVMDQTGGYSVLGPAASDSEVAGCELLFLRVEQGDKWNEFIKMKAPDTQYQTGVSRKQQCPELHPHIQMLESYELSQDEKEYFYNKGGAFVQDWFNVYGFMDNID